MHTLPMLHMTIRDWYDDDDFEEDILEDYKAPSSQEIVIHMDESSPNIPLSKSNTPSNSPQGVVEANLGAECGNDTTTAMISSIKDSIEKMKLTELQVCLKNRKMKSSGSKSILQARLLLILLKEAGIS
jgi:hypothetical protein